MVAQAFFGIILLEVCLFIIYCTWCDLFIIVIYTHISWSHYSSSKMIESSDAECTETSINQD